MPDHTTPSALATADLLRIISIMQDYQASIIGGDDKTADELRQSAHNMLDSYLDHSGAAALAVRALLPR